MTAVAVFTGSGNDTTHILADTLVSQQNTPLKSSRSRQKTLSTGLILDDSDQTEFEFTEGTLKIAQIGRNIALGYAGNVRAGNEVFRLLKEKGSFNTFPDLKQFLTSHAIPSVTPCEGGLEICGFILVDSETTKFFFDSHGNLESSQDSSTIYEIGSGGAIIGSLKTRIIGDEKPLDPAMEFILLAQEFYTNELLGQKHYIKENFSGGAISGLYAREGKIIWQKSHTILSFSNVGKTKNLANFEWIPFVKKTWYEKGNYFTSSLILRNDGKGFDQKVNQFSNSISSPIPFDQTNLIAEMTTFESDSLTSILFPKGFAKDLLAMVFFSKRSQNEAGKYFIEEIEGRRLKKVRVSPRILEKLNDYVIVDEDFTIRLNLTNDENWEVLGSSIFRRRGFLIDFNTGSETRKFLCLEGNFYIKNEEPHFLLPVEYFHMVGVLLPPDGKLPSNPTITAIHVPVGYITSVEPGKYIKNFRKPETIPALLIMPDFPCPPDGLDEGEVKEKLMELPPCYIVHEYT